MIAAGHPPSSVWGYSPRQAVAFRMVMAKRQKREMAQALNVAALGSRGDKKALDKALKDLGG